MFPRGKHEPFARLWSLTVLCFVGMNGEITVKDRILSVENPVFLVKNSSEIKISQTPVYRSQKCTDGNITFLQLIQKS